MSLHIATSSRAFPLLSFLCALCALCALCVLCGSRFKFKLMKKIVIASNNVGKLNEIGVILTPLDIEIVAQSTLGVPEADEPHSTFIENALAKARHASQHTGLPALADDSGICVDALNGLPGVHSARYACETPDG